MAQEGQYIYCIIGTRYERNFGSIGIGGRNDEVLTIGYNDLSMAVSSHPMGKLVVNRDNMLTHERVIEEVMKEFDAVLPVRFGTIAASADDIRGLLDRRAREFKAILKDMDHKIELGVKGIWKDMDEIFAEIVQENEGIRATKEIIQKDSDKKSLQIKMDVGKKVWTVLQSKKKQEAEKIAGALRRTAMDYKLNKTVSDEIFMNAAFLVDKGREKEFDNIMDDLSDKYKQRIKFMYAGPLPVFNFANIVIYPEEWEK